MKIYEADLDGFASDLVDRCMATRRDRIQMYTGLYHYWLFGAQDGNQAPYGKIYPHIDLLHAYTYSQATVEYDITPKAGNAEAVEVKQAELIGNRLNMYFHDCAVADKTGDALKLSYVWGSTFLKMDPRKPKDGAFHVKPYVIEPHNFGVLNEGIPDLDDQEAFVHSYYIGKDELARRVSGLPNASDIMRRITAAPVNEEDTFPESIHRIIVAGPSNMTTSTTRGLVNVPELFNQIQYKPKSIDDQVEMFELWVWDDEKDDYRTITLAEPGVVIYGRREIGNLLGIRGEHNFTHVCPNRLHNYFYGWSEVTNLIRLQDWMSQRLAEIRRIMTLQANPPKSFSGFGGINDEKAFAFGSPDSFISDPTPNAKVEFLAPKVPENLFDEIYAIQGFYNDISGLSDVLQGKGESGVRSKAQTDTLAKLGSARIKQRAQAVERCLEDIGALMVKMMRKKDDHRYKLEDQEFIAAQFTDDYQVHVDAHSASPVFVDDHKQLALALAKAGVIDGKSVLELTKPPKLELLKKRYEENQARRAAQVQQMIQSGQMQPGKKGLKAV